MTAHHSASAAPSGALASLDGFWSAASKGLIQALVTEQQRIEQAALQGMSVDFQKQLLAFKLAQLVSSGALTADAAGRLQARILGEPASDTAKDKTARSASASLEAQIEHALSITRPEAKTGTITTGLAVVGGAALGSALGGPVGGAIGIIVAIAAATAEA